MGKYAIKESLQISSLTFFFAINVSYLNDREINTSETCISFLSLSRTYKYNVSRRSVQMPWQKREEERDWSYLNFETSKSEAGEQNLDHYLNASLWQLPHCCKFQLNRHLQPVNNNAILTFQYRIGNPRNRDKAEPEIQ